MSVPKCSLCVKFSLHIDASNIFQFAAPWNFRPPNTLFTDFRFKGEVSADKAQKDLTFSLTQNTIYRFRAERRESSDNQKSTENDCLR